jgi:peptide deformylase
MRSQHAVPQRKNTGTPRKVRVVGDPVLSAPSREVTAFDDDLATLIEDMFATMALAEGVGLAAPQVGVDLRVFVYDCPDDARVQRTGYLINPVLGPISERKQDGEEGCLSVPGPYHELERPFEVTMSGVDLSGAPVQVTGTGFFARCLMHEYEHLKGMLFIDHLPRGRRRRLLRELEPFDWNAPVP